MATHSRRNGNGSRPAPAAKYDAHHTVLAKTYGPLADLRRELADSKAAVSARADTLKLFSDCSDSQRAWLLLEDYFEKLSLSRRDFNGEEWWPRLMSVRGPARLEETAILFLRANRPLPPELLPHANFDRFVEIERTAQEQDLIKQLEHWLFPPSPVPLDSPRAALRLLCRPQSLEQHEGLHGLAIDFLVFRPRTGEKAKSFPEIIELTTRAAHEQELFPAADWEFIQWAAETYADRTGSDDQFCLSGLELLQWLARWGDNGRLILAANDKPIFFHGHVAELKPHLDEASGELSFTHQFSLSGKSPLSLDQAEFFAGRPPVVLVENEFYLLRNAPAATLLGQWSKQKSVPVNKLGHRLLTCLRKTQSDNGVNWEQLCVAHAAVPQFMFELADDTVRLSLLARSERDQSLWRWNGHEWDRHDPKVTTNGKPEILDDVRLEPTPARRARLDLFTPEAGLWVGDANESFLNKLEPAWP